MWLIVLYQLTAQIQQETISYMNLNSLKKWQRGIKIVDDNLAEAGSDQKTGYDSGTVTRSDLNRSVPVRLSVSTASKLDSH